MQFSLTDHCIEIASLATKCMHYKPNKLIDQILGQNVMVVSYS